MIKNLVQSFFRGAATSAGMHAASEAINKTKQKIKQFKQKKLEEAK